MKEKYRSVLGIETSEKKEEEQEQDRQRRSSGPEGAYGESLQLAGSLPAELGNTRESVKEKMPMRRPVMKKLTFGDLYRQLLDTKKASDSFAMTLVKERLQRLDGLSHKDKKDAAYPAEYRREVMGLKNACLNYREVRFPDGNAKNERHAIVAKLITRAEEYLDSGSDPAPEGISSFGYTQAREAVYALSGTRGMAGTIAALNELDNLLAERMPKDKDACIERRELLVRKYGELAGRLKSYTSDPDRLTAATKNRYRILSELELQLETELERLRAWSFKDRSLKARKKSWSSILVPKLPDPAEKNLVMLDRALGTSFYTKEPGKEYHSMQQINELARQKKLEICYSEQTLLDLTILQLMDLIAGIKEHPRDSLSFRYRERKTGGRRILELYDVKASAAGLNGFGDRHKEIELPRAYDTAFAEKLLKLRPEKVLASMKKLGYAAGEWERLALKERFLSLQKRLGEDRDERKPTPELMHNVIRQNTLDSFTLIDRNLVGDGYSNEYSQKIRQRTEEKTLPKERKKEEKKAGQGRERQLTENQKKAEKLNAVADRLSNSAEIRKLSKRYIEEKAKSLIPADAGEEIRGIFGEIMAYTSADHTAEGLPGVRFARELERLEREQIEKYNERYDVADLFEDRNKASGPAEPAIRAGEKQSGKDRRTHFWAADSDALVYEKCCIYSIKKRIREYRTKLVTDNKRLSQEEFNKELDLLSELEKLFAFSDGSLDTGNIPRDAKRISDEHITYMKDGKALVMRSVKWMPLFDHEPCMEDVMQGSLADCYLLASLASIVERNPGFIREMMHDDGDRITVRLYDDEKKPVYLSMKKELPAPVEPGRDLFAAGAFWVMYLEKAVTLLKTGMMGKVNDGKRELRFVKGLFTAGRRYYDDVSGGYTQNILPILTGRDTETYVTMPRVTSGEKIYQKTDEEIRRDHRDLVEGVISQIENEQKAGRIMAATSRDFIPDDSRKGLNNEHLTQGIVLTHAYSVLGVDMVNGRKMIRLRNPWGVGRIHYDVQEGTDMPIIRWGDPQKPGEFYITPERFVAYFHNVASVTVGQMKAEDVGREAVYEKNEDQRFRKKLAYAHENTDDIPSSFDRKKWNGILQEFTRTDRAGEEKDKYSIFYKIRQGNWDDAGKAGLKEPRLQLAGSVGDTYLNLRNENVLEFDLAGTGAELYTRGYSLAEAEMTEEQKENHTSARYGEKVDGYEHIRCYEKKNKEKTAKKTRYNMGGATILNGGENSMQNVEQRMLEFGSRWLTPILDEMLEDEAKRKEVHVLVNAYSRGAAAGDAGLMRLGQWLHKNYPPVIAKLVRFELLLNDPTPGYGSRSGIYEKADISSGRSYDKKGRETDDPEKEVYRGLEGQISSTVIYSLKSGARAILDPQKVMGADRVIISPFEHNYVETTGRSAENGGRIVHRRPYIDPLTGCAYRASGLNALPKGFYFADTDNMLIRVNSYAEFQMLLEKLLNGYTRDGLRTAVIDEVAKDFFAEKQ